MGDQHTPGQRAQREWTMAYMARNSFGGYPAHFDTGTTYNKGADFCEAFSEAFPGRKADPSLSRTSQRLARLMRGMWNDGLVSRGLLGNEKYLPQEPSWQYVYSLFPRDLQRRRVLDEAALLADANAHYSDVQQDEIARVAKTTSPAPQPTEGK